MLFPEETLTRQWRTATTLDKYLDAIWLAKGQKRSNAVHSERTYHHVRPWPATAEALPYRLTSFGLDVISPLLYNYTIKETTLEKKYRISSNKSRGYYSFLKVRCAASIWGRPLIKGGYYYKIPQKLREIALKTDNFRHISTILAEYKPYYGHYLRAAIILHK